MTLDTLVTLVLSTNPGTLPWKDWLIFATHQCSIFLIHASKNNRLQATSFDIKHLWQLQFLVADMQLYKRLCSSVSTLIRWSVRGHRVEKWENEPFGYFLCMFECWGWVGEWMGFGCPCLPVRNDIVTPRHLLLKLLASICKVVISIYL